MDFVLIYNVTGKGHNRGFSRIFTADKAKEAFVEAVEAAKSQGYDPDTFATFMIQPQHCGTPGQDALRGYRTLSHGWDGKQTYPTKR